MIKILCYFNGFNTEEKHSNADEKCPTSEEKYPIPEGKNSLSESAENCTYPEEEKVPLPDSQFDPAPLQIAVQSQYHLEDECK